MKNFIAVIICGLILSACTVSPQIRNGVGSSGGGKGVRCGDSVRTLDLYEAAGIHHLTLNSPGSTLEEKFVYGAKKFFAHDLRWELGNEPIYSDAQVLGFLDSIVREKFTEVAPGSVPLSDDATVQTLPEGCEFVQIALYDDLSDKILLDPVLWSALSPVDQAALALHEFIYKYSRIFRSQNSDESRRFVGLTFSSESLEPVWKEAYDKPIIDCLTHDSSGINEDGAYLFTFFETTEGGRAGVRTQFMLLNGYAPLFKTSVFYPDLTLSKVLLGEFPESALVTEPLMNRSWNLDLYFDGEEEPGKSFKVQVRSSKGGEPFSEYFPATCILSSLKDR